MSESEEGEAAPRTRFEMVTVKLERCDYDEDSPHRMDIRIRSTPEQFLMIVEFMESHMELARPGPGLQGKLRAERLWEDLTDILNSSGDTVKRSKDKWKKVWADWKTKTKKKAITIQSEAASRGVARQALSPMEERVLRIMGITSVTGRRTERGQEGRRPPAPRPSALPPPAPTPAESLSPTFIELDYDNPLLEEVEIRTSPALSPPPAPVAPPSPPSPPPRPPRRRPLRPRRRAMTPLERAATRFVAIEERRLRMEEKRERRLHQREVEREQMLNEREVERLRVESQRLQVESRRNELLQCLADIPQILVELLAQFRPRIPDGSYEGPPAEQRSAGRRSGGRRRIKLESAPTGLQPTDADDAVTREYLARPRCAVCGHCFRSEAARVRHERMHAPPPATASPPCAVCGRRFLSAAAALRHERRAACDPAARTCQECGKTCRSAPLLRSHSRVHEAERPHPCEECGAAFKYRSTLARHALLHAGRRPHACPVCGKTFTHPGLIRPHMRMHTGERPYECVVCLRRFSHKHNMMRHSLGHATAKRLECEVCHRKFPKESRLRYHMRVHSEDKRPFKCERCPKAFSHRQNVQRHYARKHPGVEYTKPDTDASVARRLWEQLPKRPPDTHILPDADAEDTSAEEAPVIVEVDIERITLKKEE